MFQLLGRLYRWLDGTGPDSYAQLVLYIVAGIAAGYFIASIAEQTALLEDLYILAHEQQRITLARVRREMASTMAATTTDNNGEQPANG